MAMDIFSVNPSSFQMNKNSTFASKLKASIIDKLNQCLVQYSDDVLAEYIVVLICNGKNQHQARYDLEAFLGEDSKEFVSWLWNLLLESVKRTLYLEDDFENGGGVNNKHRSLTSRRIHGHAKGDVNVLPQDEEGFTPQPGSSNDKSKGSQHYSHESNSSLNEIHDMEGGTKSLKHGFSKRTGSTEGNYRGVSKYAPSRGNASSSSEDRSDSERNISSVNEDKIVKKYSADLPCQPLHLPKDERFSNNSKSNARETDVAGRRSFSRPTDSVFHPNAKPRGSVWDRLGRPRDDDRNVRGKSIEVHDPHVVKRTVGNSGEPYDHKKMVHIVPGCRRTGEAPACDNSSVIFTPNICNADEDRRPEHTRNRIWVPPHHADKINKKRKFNAISVEECKYRHLQCTEPPLKQLQKSSPSKSTHSDILNNISSGTRQTEPLLAGKAFQSSNTAFIPVANVGPQRKLCEEATDTTKTNLKPVQSQLLDMKLRLHQIEMEMCQIKAKKPEINADTSKSLSSSGDLNQSDDDVESRTIFVTNVHFAATKEALSLHFVKCGVIAKVVILTDAVTTKPKGAAYVTFAEKEYVDKAVALSGTSFWSRPLKVVRKAEICVIPSPHFSVRKRNLQWRRDQPAASIEQNDSEREEGEPEESRVEEETKEETRVEAA